MKITTCYTVPIKRQLTTTGRAKGERKITGSRPVNDTLMRRTADLCLDALRFCVDAFLSEWGYLSSLPVTQKAGVMSRRRAADLMVHSTKDNNAPYQDFDRLFPYMPAYTRRAIIADALGMVSSYVSNHGRWEGEERSGRGAEPVMGLPERYELTFYDQERDLCDIGKGIIGLKLYDGKKWGWHYFLISPSDAGYISRMKEERDMLSPVVEKVRGRYRIRFAFEENKDLVPDDSPLDYRILAVDLGINAPASWCVMTADGTVHARGVIHLRSDEDRLCHLVNRKRMYQKAGKRSHSIYRMLTGANRQLSIDTCREIMRISELYDTDCIVFEHLERNGKARGRKFRERIHMWRVADVQKRVTLQAHRRGMRISRVCAWGTSKYAFDGSGEVARGKDADLGTYSLCRFPTGKVYNCDLSAAQNIGARFFLREYAKLPGCPGLPKTPRRTYDTLVSLVRSMAA